mgnify:CR=1 FL=1
MSKLIVSAIMLSFADAHCADSEMSKAMAVRNLSFRAAGPLSKTDAIRAARAAMPHGYNEFDADVLTALPDNAQITFARESSPAIYIKGNPLSLVGGTYEQAAELHAAFKADEMSYNAATDESRIWWD